MSEVSRMVNKAQRDKVESRTDKKCPSCGRNFCVLCIPARPSVPQQGQADGYSEGFDLEDIRQLVDANFDALKSNAFGLKVLRLASAYERLAASRSEEATPPAQSDAPSAESFTDWYERTSDTPIEDIGVFSHQHIVKAAEAYAALRTAQLTDDLQTSWQIRGQYFELSKKRESEFLERIAQLERQLADFQGKVTHFWSNDKRFCGSKVKPRQIVFDETKVTCPDCKRKGELV